MKKILILFFLISSFSSFPQSYEDIKSKKDIYIFGEGKSVTIETAKSNALNDLITQISVTVNSSFEFLTEEESYKKDPRKKNSSLFNEKVTSIVNTYANATLTNVEQLTISDEPNAHIFLYIKRDNLKKIFQDRKNKIIKNFELALDAEKKYQISDALRLLYWSLILLKSHPECNSIKYNIENVEIVLVSWIPLKINSIFSKMDYSIKDIKENESFKEISVFFTYDNHPVTNLDFKYFDGKNYSDPSSCRDGIGFMEVTKLYLKEKDYIKAKIEYMFLNQSNLDKEIDLVLKQTDNIKFRNSELNIFLNKKDNTTNSSNSINTSNSTNLNKTNINTQNTTLNRVSNSLNIYKDANFVDSKPFKSIIEDVAKNMKSNTNNLSEKYFTPECFNMFTELINKGNPKVIGTINIISEKFNDEVICRDLTVNFSFKSNKHNFIEHLVFTFNKDFKIDNVSFGLNDIAISSIDNNPWTRNDKLTLIHTLENYRTAYYLKRLDYIKSIFSDNALIIVGRNVKVLNTNEENNKYLTNKKIVYNKLSKTEYIEHLEYVFNSNEYINLEFEKSTVEKGGKGGNVYGIQIKQNYYSQNYGDEGYLFLIVDLNDIKTPKIHVRTWQPYESKEMPYSLGDF